MADGTNDPSDGRWRAHPWLAMLLRLAIVAGPVALSCLVTWVLIHTWHPHAHRWLSLVGLCSIAVLVGLVAERFARRALPLAALLRITMLFPDRAPSRMRVARAAGSSKRRLHADLGRQRDQSAATAAEKVLTLITALGNHDRKTRGHSERVRLFTDMLAAELHLPEPARDRLRWASLLHDVGKLTIAPTILNKPAKLDNDEFTLMKQHPAIGADLAAPLLPWLGEWGRGILEHHERYDGTGYPNGISGTDISSAGRMIAVIDSFETMTAARSYKKPMPAMAARQELARCAGSQFDPDYVRAFLAVSLPRLLWAMGPTSLLAQLPLLRPLLLAKDSAATVAAQAGNVVTSAAAVATISAGTVLSGAAASPALAAQPHAAVPAQQAVSAHGSGRPAKHRVASDPVAAAIAQPSPAAPTSVAPVGSTPTTPPTTAPSPQASTPDAPTVDVPDAPVGVAVTPGNRTATLTWAAGESDGGSPLTAYTITASEGAAAPITVDGATTSVVVTGLTNGVAYTFDVRAHNAVGQSAAASSSRVRPTGPPAAPTSVAALPDDASVTLSWNAPTDDGASPITGYAVTARSGGVVAGSWQLPADSTIAVLAPLTNGTSYVFEIAAENANGSSGAANSAPVTPAAPPSSAQVPATPLNVTAVSGDAQATVTWAAPADGGSPITSYTLTARRGSTTVGQWQVQAGTTQRLLTGLTNGASYVFDVTARNAVGDSAPASSNAVTPATVPDAPGSVSAQPGDGQAAVSWNAPADDGGSAITSYAVTPVGPNGALASTSVPAGSSSTVISGLTNGVSYRFSVRAVNAVGSSAAATSAPVTPQWPGPSSVTAAPDNASATVTWLAPVAGGQPVVSYTVYVYRGGSLIRSIAVGSSATTVIVSSLTNGVSYQFAVAANFGGSSTAPSSLSNAVTPFAPPWWRNPPSNPRNVTAVAGIHQATVSWQVPASTGGTPITSYLIVVRDATDNFTLKTLLVSGSTTSAVVTGLQSGLKYRFRVVATNAAGSSPSSGSSKITIL